MDISIEEDLFSSTNEEIEKNLSELFEWTQDINWPVAPIIIRRFSTLGMVLIQPITQILEGKDEPWKWTIINFLLPIVDKEIIEQLYPLLNRIATNPTIGEANEELDNDVKKLLTG